MDQSAHCLFLLLSRSLEVCDFSLPPLLFFLLLHLFLSPLLLSLPLSPSHPHIFSTCVSACPGRETKAFSEQHFQFLPHTLLAHYSQRLCVIIISVDLSCVVVKEPQFWIGHTWVWILAQPLTSLVAWDKLSLRTSVSSSGSPIWVP